MDRSIIDQLVSDQAVARQGLLTDDETLISARSRHPLLGLIPSVVGRGLLTTLLVIASLWGLMQSADMPSLALGHTELAINNQPFARTRLPLQQSIIGDYRVKFALNPGDSRRLNLQIIPDDELLSLSVNGQSISLADYSRNDLRNYSTGIVVYLNDLLPAQTNWIELQLNNYSNPAGLTIKPIETLTPVRWLGLLVSLILLVIAMGRHIRLPASQHLLLIAGLAASLVYLSHTDPNTRTFDVYEGGGHRDYIDYLLEHRKAPPPGEGWEYHQPPLYYVIGALSKHFFVGSETASDLWGQALALWFWTVFLVAALASLNTAFSRNSRALILVSVALCFWPAGIIHSIRIGNDLPLYAFYALAFYYSLRWWRSHSTPHLWYASLWASLALLTKSNALAVWGVIGVLFFAHSYRLWQHRHAQTHSVPKIFRNLMILSGCFVVTMAINFGDNLWHYFEGSSSDWLLSNVSESINPGLAVNNKPLNYLIFDSATFFREPFMSTWSDEFGRQYFWNFVWRSALTSEFFFEGTRLQAWGVLNGVLLIMMLVGIFIYAIQQQALMNRRQWLASCYKNLPWLLAVIMPFLLLLAYRIKVPLSCNTDFRYIYPVLVPLLFFSAFAWKKFPRGKLTWLLASGAPLIGVSSWFWLFNL